MTFADLLALLRRTRLGDTVEPYQFSDADCAEALNDAQRQAAIRKRLILDNSTEDLCVFAVTAADAGPYTTIEHHPRMLAVRTARWSGNPHPLALTTLKVMDRDNQCWMSEDVGCPTHLIVDRETGKLDLWPAPDADGTLTLAVWRSPLEDEEIIDGDFDLEPVIDETFHRDLLDWAEHWLYLTKDAEGSDPARANAAAQRFEAKFGPLPSAHEIKCWGLGKGRGQRAQFL